MTRRCLIPILALTVAAFVSPAMAADALARSATVLRAGPGATYPHVAVVGNGEKVEIFGCLRRATWCDVATGGDRGWLQGRHLDYLANGQRDRLDRVFSSLGLNVASFRQNDYWGSHYADRPFFNDRRWQREAPAPYRRVSPNLLPLTARAASIGDRPQPCLSLQTRAVSAGCFGLHPGIEASRLSGAGRLPLRAMQDNLD